MDALASQSVSYFADTPAAAARSGPLSARALTQIAISTIRYSTVSVSVLSLSQTRTVPLPRRAPGPRSPGLLNIKSLNAPPVEY